MALIDEILTLSEAAELLGNVTADTLRQQVRKGRLSARLIGKTYVTTREEVDRYRSENLGQVGRPATRALAWQGRNIFMPMDSGVAQHDDAWLQRFGRAVRASERAGETAPDLERRLASLADEIGATVEVDRPNGPDYPRERLVEIAFRAR